MSVFISTKSMVPNADAVALAASNETLVQASAHLVAMRKLPCLHCQQNEDNAISGS